jgi:TRAP-type uncharacterized transport system fused permease subunit
METNIEKVLISWTLQNIVTVFLMVTIVSIVIGLGIKISQSTMEKKSDAK